MYNQVTPPPALPQAPLHTASSASQQGILQALARWAVYAPSTVDYFQIRQQDDTLYYPILDADGRPHQRGRSKSLLSSQVREEREVAKYGFTGPTAIPKPDFYHPAGFHYAAQQQGELIIASGEPAVWALWERGCKNVVSWFGEGNQPKDLLDQLRQHGIRQVSTYTDRDRAGDGMAVKLRDTLHDGGILYFPYELPLPRQEKGGPDLNDYLRTLPDSAAEARPRLHSLPYLTLPERAVRALPAAPTMPRGNLQGNPFWVQYVSELGNLLGVERYNAKGWSSKSIPCPFHDDRHPSASWHQDGTLHCHTEEKSYSAKEVGAALGLPWEAFRDQHQPARSLPRPTLEAPQDLAVDALPADQWHFAEGLPVPLARLLLNLHRTFRKIKVPRYVNAVLTWFLWHEAILAGLLQPDEPFTIQRLRDCAVQLGRKVKDNAIRVGLILLACLGIFQEMTPCSSLPGSNYGCQISKNSVGRPAQVYSALPLQTALANLQAWLNQCHLECVQWESHDPAALETLLPDGLLTPQQMAAVQRKRADLGLAGAQNGPASCHEDVHHYCVGSTLSLPTGVPLPNATAFQDALHVHAVLSSPGGQRQISLKQVSEESGRSASSVLRARKRNHIMTRSNFDEYPVPSGSDILAMIHQHARYILDRHGVGAWLVVNGTRHHLYKLLHKMGWGKEQLATWLAGHTALNHEVCLQVQRASTEQLAADEVEWQAHLRQKAQENIQPPGKGFPPRQPPPYEPVLLGLDQSLFSEVYLRVCQEFCVNGESSNLKPALKMDS